LRALAERQERAGWRTYQPDPVAAESAQASRCAALHAPFASNCVI